MKPGIDPNKVVECSLCLEIITPPISHCEVGHTACKSCIDANGLKECPECRGPLSTRRHVAFEQLLESFRQNLKINCRYAYKGCKYNIGSENKEDHERDCRNRTFRCEGKTFAGWDCNWTGDYENIEKHFKESHLDKTLMQYRVESATQKINFESNFKDVHLINFYNGQALFYYKHCVDVQKQKIYWLFQYIGLKSNAEHFYYEFEIFNLPKRKIKVIEYCVNDTTKADDIIKSEKCVVVTFASAKNFLNEDGELPFKYRIIKDKPVNK